MIRCGVPSTCPAVGNQQKMLLICNLGFSRSSRPLKRMDPFEWCVSIIGLLLRFVLNQQFDLNKQLLLQVFNVGSFDCDSDAAGISGRDGHPTLMELDSGREVISSCRCRRHLGEQTPASFTSPSAGSHQFRQHLPPMQDDIRERAR